jgi:hypothetical protein
MGRAGPALRGAARTGVCLGLNGCRALGSRAADPADGTASLRARCAWCQAGAVTSVECAWSRNQHRLGQPTSPPLPLAAHPSRRHTDRDRSPADEGRAAAHVAGGDGGDGDRGRGRRRGSSGSPARMDD